MSFDIIPPKWDAEGIEPSADLQTKGFLAGYKPPAAYFNYLFNRIVACIKELQAKAVPQQELTNQDLNTVLKVGIYYAASGNTTTNVPTGVEFYGLVVVKNSSVRYSQVLYSNTTTYVRWFNGGEWTEWGVYATNTDLDNLKTNISNGVVAQANTLTSKELTNEDLNDLVPATATFYYAAGGNSVVNNPEEGQAFGLMCYRSATGHRVQEIYTQNGVKYLRHCTSDLNKVWTEWKALAYDAEIKAKLATKGTVFYKLSDIGLTTGSETIETIAKNMPVYSSLIINVGASNAAIYPNQYGVLNVTKLDTTGRVVFEYAVKSMARKYFGVYDETYTTPWTGWREFAFTDGTVDVANSLALQYNKEVTFANKPSAATNIAYGYQWLGGVRESLITGHKFFDGNGALAPVYASVLYEGDKKLADLYAALNHTHNSVATVELTDEDLNDIKPTAATFYYAAGNNTVANNPAGNGNPFGMLCYMSAYGHKAQELVTQDGTKYIRVFTTEWKAWKAVAYKDDVLGVKDIASYTNLNSITTIGFYQCVENAIAATLTNCPTTNAFYMTVGKHAGTYQEIVEYTTTAPKRYMRNCYENTWGEWYRVYTTANKPTLDELGAAAATHAHTALTPVLLTNENLDDIKPYETTYYYAAGENQVTNSPVATGSPFGLISYRSATGHRTQELVSSNKKYIRTYTTAWSDWQQLLYAGDVVDNLESTSANLPLSANQGRVLFQSVSDGKSLVASAITGKGVTTATDATFETMAANIENILAANTSKTVNMSAPNTQALSFSAEVNKIYIVVISDPGTENSCSLTSGATQLTKKTQYRSCNQGLYVHMFLVKATATTITFQSSKSNSYACISWYQIDK